MGIVYPVEEFKLARVLHLLDTLGAVHQYCEHIAVLERVVSGLYTGWDSQHLDVYIAALEGIRRQKCA